MKSPTPPSAAALAQAQRAELHLDLPDAELRKLAQRAREVSR